MKTLAILGAATAAIMSADPAAATTLLYTLYGVDTTGDVENSSWYLDSNPLVTNSQTGSFFEIDGIAGNFNYGPSFHADVNNLTFYNIGAGSSGLPGVANLFDYEGIVDIFGPKLYSGPEAKPTMLTGIFTTHDYYSGANYTLKVAAVPEAATWAMMLAGFGLVGCALRARRTSVRYG